jgi:hypothetical protein
MVVHALDRKANGQFDAGFGNCIRRNVGPSAARNIQCGFECLDRKLACLERGPARAGQSLSFAYRYNGAVYTQRYGCVPHAPSYT